MTEEKNGEKPIEQEPLSFIHIEWSSSGNAKLELHNVSPFQIWGSIGLLNHHAERMQVGSEMASMQEQAEIASVMQRIKRN